VFASLLGKYLLLVTEFNMLLVVKSAIFYQRSTLCTIPVTRSLFYSCWFTTIPMKKIGAFEALVEPKGSGSFCSYSQLTDKVSNVHEDLEEIIQLGITNKPAWTGSGFRTQ
jgi:hypothetical protein